jgi:acyl-CoA reductase-like NAD-dependent aldehyde dehydrogenase
METYGMILNGEVRVAANAFDVLNPVTEEVAGRASACSVAQLEEAMTSSAQAFRAWSADEGARREALRTGATLLAQAAEKIGPVLTMEQGKPIAQAIEEVYAAAAWIGYYAELERPRQLVRDDATGHIEVFRRPMGVVAAITPWNFPVGLATWKIGPALRAGNTMVLKPSPFTPLATVLMGEVLAEALPPGVLNVVTGDDVLGASMVSHPVPRKVSFTGSVQTGKRVAQAAALDLKRVTLELGGNDAAIVLEGTAPDQIAEAIFGGAFANAGQICSAIKRIYAHRSIVDDLTDELADRARSIVVGDGMDPATQMGPINNAPQYERVRLLVARALKNGAVAVAGGGPLDRPGYFMAPTILRNVQEGDPVVDEEQFGPVLPVMAFDDVDEAVRRANGTTFGLSGSVWSNDPDHAAEIAARLSCGTAWVNTHLALAPDLPFGGVKWSGIGVENGPWGLEEFTDIQLLHVARQSAAVVTGREA